MPVAVLFKFEFLELADHEESNGKKRTIGKTHLETKDNHRSLSDMEENFIYVGCVEDLKETVKTN